eukprot:TRINITY_DN549_c0_g1_i1.p1 TRINITY_DN549_c0_g1~~TRINITY_DN549_c0_g1_i1.p1  ORF type:complete len:101 (+),score=25.97 TRINITY_DN549_c0_g1_i1:57-359(+)
MKNQKIKLAGVLLGAALTSTGALAASGSCGAGKCGSEPKKVEKKGSCGAGKCGSDKKMKPVNNEMSGNAGKKTDMACGAGKCGANMNKKVEGSCGAGKCG